MKIKTRIVCDVDQSNKVEQTEKDTVVALSNGVKLTILMRSKDKRFLQEVFRSRGEPRNFVLFTFSLLLTRLLKHAKLAVPVRIDLEYKGNEDIIREKLILYSKRLGYDLDRSLITFKSIGKRSPAHKLAGKVTARKQNPDLRITIEEAVEILFPRKKIGHPEGSRSV